MSSAENGCGRVGIVVSYRKGMLVHIEIRHLRYFAAVAREHLDELWALSSSSIPKSKLGIPATRARFERSNRSIPVP
jgi:hypothetical protein